MLWVSNDEKEAGTTWEMSNRKGLNITDHNKSRDVTDKTEMTQSSTVVLEITDIQKSNFLVGFENEEVANRSNPCVMPVQLSIKTGLYCGIVSDLLFF